MSITLPPLPLPATFALFAGTARQGSEFRLIAQDYEPTCAQYTATQMNVYATAAIEADRASRMPMTDKQMYEMCTVWMKRRALIEGLIRATEAHHGIGSAK